MIYLLGFLPLPTPLLNAQFTTWISYIAQRREIGLVYAVDFSLGSNLSIGENSGKQASKLTVGWKEKGI